MKFQPIQSSCLFNAATSHHQRRSETQRLRQGWWDLLGTLLLSAGLLSFGVWAIAAASYRVLEVTDSNVEQIASPLAWDF